MTDHHDPLDEIASAQLDGEATPEEAALLAADPDHAARMARLAAVREAVRAPIPPLPDHARDRAIAAALSATDDTRSPAADDRSTPAAIPLAAATLPRRGPRRTLQLAGIAAVVALLALAVPLLGSLDSGSPDHVAAPPEQSSLDASKEATAHADAGFGAAERSQASPPLSDDLGAFDDLPGLTEAVRGRLSAPTADAAASPSTQAASEGTPVCSGEPDADGTVIYGALATYEGHPVVVFVRENPDGGRTLVVLDRVDCSELAGGKL